MEVVQSCFGSLVVDCWSVLERSDKVIVTVVEVLHVFFITRNILKPDFHNCRGGVMLVDS